MDARLAPGLAGGVDWLVLVLFRRPLQALQAEWDSGGSYRQLRAACPVLVGGTGSCREVSQPGRRVLCVAVGGRGSGAATRLAAVGPGVDGLISVLLCLRGVRTCMGH